MTDTAEPAVRQKSPWHLWLVGALALLWNSYGCYDYVMTNTGGEDYLRAYGMTQAQIDYFSAMPSWMTGVWAVGVWGAALASILLLFRRRWAFHVFVISFAAFALSVIYTYVFTDGAAVNGAMGMIMSAVIGAAGVFFIWYAWAMKKRGVLR